MKIKNQVSSNTCCSAQQVAELSKSTSEKQGRETAYQRTLEAGAEASISQQKLLDKQIRLLQQQNETLSGNYNKLKELYDAQVQTATEAREDLHRSRVFNGWMMVIAVVSMLAAVASPVITIWLSR